jgi:spermidine/putrescine transport system substrate-binding protein
MGNFDHTLTTAGKKTMDKYAVGYMWGTMGILYNPAKVTHNVNSWDILWNNDTAYNKSILMKNSVRDCYMTAAFHLGLDPNDTSDATIAKIEAALKTQKTQASFKGYEVDEGKNDMINGTAALCLQWAGDAAWAIEEAANLSPKRELRYVIPEEGSNVFFDAYVIPKYSKGKRAMAEEFINFLCDEEIAFKNMDYIGYTSCVATPYMFELLTEDAGTGSLIDVSYFFVDADGEYDDEGFDVTRAPLSWIQYPDEETLSRCYLMFDFGARLDAVNEMWIRVGNTR